MARSNNDPKCIQHARFAAHLDRAHFDIIYWVLFIIVILMLFAASFRYGRLVGPFPVALFYGLRPSPLTLCIDTNNPPKDPSTRSQISSLAPRSTSA